jgi:hypothetical protein
MKVRTAEVVSRPYWGSTVKGTLPGTLGLYVGSKAPPAATAA